MLESHVGVEVGYEFSKVYFIPTGAEISVRTVFGSGEGMGWRVYGLLGFRRMTRMNASSYDLVPVDEPGMVSLTCQSAPILRYSDHIPPVTCESTEQW